MGSVPVLSAGLAQAVEGQVLKPASVQVIEGQYIVVLNPAGPAVAAAATSLTSHYGGNVGAPIT